MNLKQALKAAIVSGTMLSDLNRKIYRMNHFALIASMVCLNILTTHNSHAQPAPDGSSSAECNTTLSTQRAVTHGENISLNLPDGWNIEGNNQLMFIARNSKKQSFIQISGPRGKGSLEEMTEHILKTYVTKGIIKLSKDVEIVGRLVSREEYTLDGMNGETLEIYHNRALGGQPGIIIYTALKSEKGFYEISAIIPEQDKFCQKKLIYKTLSTIKELKL